MRRVGIASMLLAVTVLLLFGPAAPVAALEVGDKAPDFSLPATTQEKPLTLSEFNGKKNVLLFGFVGAWTPTWTTEAAALQRDLSQFESRNTQVVGISADFPMSQAPWAEKMGLTYPLLSDWQTKTLRAYGILETQPDHPIYWRTRRAYMLIDKDGIVRWTKILADPSKALSDDELLAEVDKVVAKPCFSC